MYSLDHRLIYKKNTPADLYWMYIPVVEANRIVSKKMYLVFIGEGPKGLLEKCSGRFDRDGNHPFLAYDFSPLSPLG